MVIYMIHPDFRSIINGETNGSVRENGNAAECCEVQLQEFKSKVYGRISLFRHGDLLTIHTFQKHSMPSMGLELSTHMVSVSMVTDKADKGNRPLPGTGAG